MESYRKLKLSQEKLNAISPVSAPLLRYLLGGRIMLVPTTRFQTKASPYKRRTLILFKMDSPNPPRPTR